MPLLPASMLPAMAASGARTVAQMRDQRRVLLIAAPAADDPRLRAQRATLASWSKGATDRDVIVVELVGRTTSGAADDPASLRARFHLLPSSFAVVLIGKDGHEAYRSAAPVTAQMLQGTIDAMPMRRAGQR
ncbi:DUF4174 domain-containing protein [uncultured Sphingomonas sp.]|uniref:DUF4174 domain-containing protein n=1 Tax=uncultured Sphingomonas sp. TaxID=158754 RepID=UPI0035CC288E